VVTDHLVATRFEDLVNCDRVGSPGRTMKCGSQPADISLINRRYRRFPNKKKPRGNPGAKNAAWPAVPYQ